MQTFAQFVNIACQKKAFREKIFGFFEALILRESAKRTPHNPPNQQLETRDSIHHVLSRELSINEGLKISDYMWPIP